MTRTETITIENDTTIQGYGILYAGTYTVEMPADYDPGLVTAYDIILDAAMRIVPADEVTR